MAKARSGCESGKSKAGSMTTDRAKRQPHAMISNPLTPNPAAPPCRVLVAAGQPMTAGAQAILNAKRAVLQNSTPDPCVPEPRRYRSDLERSRAGGRNRQAGRRRKVVSPSRGPENPASAKIGPIAAVLDDALVHAALVDAGAEKK
jgi:hypothetical protein